jgi:hypothetical protein
MIVVAPYSEAYSIVTISSYSRKILELILCCCVARLRYWHATVVFGDTLPTKYRSNTSNRSKRSLQRLNERDKQ